MYDEIELREKMQEEINEIEKLRKKEMMSSLIC